MPLNQLELSESMRLCICKRCSYFVGDDTQRRHDPVCERFNVVYHTAKCVLRLKRCDKMYEKEQSQWSVVCEGSEDEE
jgi:hypothetical protein